MGNIFDDVAAQPQPQPVNAPVSTPTSSPAAAPAAPTSGNIFDSVAAEQAKTPTTTTGTIDTPHDLTVTEYTALPKDKQAEYDAHVRAGRSVFDPATGFLKGVGETVNTLSGLISRVVPSVVRPQDVNALKNTYTASNPMQQIGKVGENIAEFFMGDEALKGLTVAERLGLAGKVAKLAESNPIIARIVSHGLTAVRGGAVTTAQQMAHGATPTEALKTGAEATALGGVTGAAIEGASGLADATGVSEKLASARRGGILSGGQPKLQTAISNAARTGTDVAAARTAASNAAETAANVKVPDQYKAIIDEAMKSEPAWTPESAKPIAKALGKDFEIRGSVAEGKSTDNDLDIWQKNPKANPADTLTKNGFTYSHDTPHGEVWTKGDQHVDLWDSEHEPIKGHGSDAAGTEVAEETPTTPKGNVPTKTTGIRTAIADVSDDVKAKSQGLYRQLDQATGGRWQRYEDQIKNIEAKMDEVNGIDDETYDRLETKRNDIETSQAQAIEDLKAKGIDPKIADDAVGHYKQAMALRDLDKAVKISTTGDVRLDMSEKVNPKMFVNRVQKLYDSGRLKQALGDDGAKALLKAAYDAKNAQSIRRWMLAVSGLVAAASGVGHAFGVAKAGAEAAAAF